MDQPEPGSILGHYKIISRLGAGGMGVVYEAEDMKLGRHVALKLLPGAADPAALERFWREARAASALNHPGICTLYEINESQSQPFLVMELLEGQSLDRMYGGHAVPLPRLIELGVQIADALDAAHRKGILHRDIKPANIFVTSSGQTKILDFGLARFEDHSTDDTAATGLSERQMITTPGSTLGTIAYMSPEQARGEALDARGDVFSLGVVLYELGTGRHPFEGTTTAIVFDKLLNYMPPSPNSINHGLPPEFESIVTKALEKDRDLRYQSAADLRADLRRLQRVSSASRVMASGVMLSTATSYPGMTRAATSTAIQSAPPEAVRRPSAEASAPAATGSAADFSALRAATLAQAPPEAPPPPEEKDPSESRKQFRMALLILTAVVILLSVWMRFFRHPRPQLVAAVPATAAASGAAPAGVPAATSPSTTPAVQPGAAPAGLEAAPPTKPSAATAADVAPAKPAARPKRPPAKAAHADHIAAPPTIQMMPAPAPVVPANPPPAQPAAAVPAQPAITRPAPPPAASHPAAPPAPAVVTYNAHHMHAFPYIGGRSCEGTLQFTSNELIFNSDTHPVTLTRAGVSAIDGNTVVQTNGKKWRFEIDDMTNGQVHDLLVKWFNGGVH